MTEEKIEGGCVLIARNILNSEIWRKPPAYLKIFMYILLKVNHKDGLFPRGTNFFNFSDEKPAGVTKNQVYEFLRWAKEKNTNIITTQKTTRGMIIKVNNYNDYQTLSNYYLQDKNQEITNTTPKQNQHSPNTINNNVIMKECNNIISYLNQQSGFKYKLVKSNINLIKARLKDYSEEELLEMVQYKCNEWRNNEEFRKYLRPATLFNSTKCEMYVAQSKQHNTKPNLTTNTRALLKAEGDEW